MAKHAFLQHSGTNEAGSGLHIPDYPENPFNVTDVHTIQFWSKVHDISDVFEWMYEYGSRTLRQLIGGGPIFTADDRWVHNHWTEDHNVTPYVPAIDFTGWTHFTVTYDGGGVGFRTDRVYRNGCFLDRWVHGGDLNLPSANIFNFLSNSLAVQYACAAFELRFWNIKREPADILTDFAHELGGSETGLVAYFKMKEGTGNPVDTVGNATSTKDGVQLTWQAEEEVPGWVGGPVPPPGGGLAFVHPLIVR